MSFADCIVSARDQGVLSPEEAERLIARYEAHRQARRAAGEADPEAGARSGLADEFDAAAERQRRLAALSTARRDAIAQHLDAYRGPDGRANVYEASMRLLENFGYSGTSSVKGRQHAIIAITHAELADTLRGFERNFYTGLRHETVKAQNVVREMLGQTTGNPEAAAFARAIGATFERLRERFNAAGGEIGKIEGGYLPQFHDGTAIMRAGFERWREFIVPRLDRGKMRDPLTDGPLSDARFEDVVRAAYDNIVSEGWANRVPTMQPQGKGALASQRSEHRFLHFKSADDWLAYDAQFGHGDPIKAMFGHINGMARDIAALEILGPNPSAMVEWLKQVVQSEHGKAVTGKESLFNLSGANPQAARDAGPAAAKAVGDLWSWVRGRETVKQGVADFYGNVRNVLTSIQLGSAAVTAATTDPAMMRQATQALGMAQSAIFGQNAKVYLDAVSRYFEQVPIARTLSTVIDSMTGAPRAQALRAGMIAEDFLHILGDEARMAGTLGGSVWSRWMADRTVTLSGLAPLTEARRAVFQLELQGFLADHVGNAFESLPERLRVKMEGYGIDAATWDRMRAVPVHEMAPGAAGLLRPADLAAADRALGEKLAEMLIGETERAIPQGTLRSKAFILGDRPKGQHAAEIFEGFLQYKSFGLSVLTLQAETIAQETARFGGAAGASYAAQLFILTTLGGAAALQLKQIANGKDPQTIKDAKFWGAAMATGGGFGLLGDFLFADVNRYGYSLPEQIAGPTMSLGQDVLKFTAGNLWELIQGKDTKIGRESAMLIGKYTPLASSLWATRLAYKREIIDQLQYQLDPQAHRRWRDEERKALKEKKQGYWWRPGETAPGRAPDLGTAIR
jgi:hypothetical protein